MRCLERMFCYIWEFRANPLRIDEFEHAYGLHGLWTRLFRRAPDYIRTELLKDPGETNRYLTIDYWVDRKAHSHRFRREFLGLLPAYLGSAIDEPATQRHVVPTTSPLASEQLL
jgi:hypothetical protein